jgi:hypothetical protein
MHNDNLNIYILGQREKIHRNRPKKYNSRVIKALRDIWYICDCICSKRLKAILKEVIKVLEEKEEIVLDDETRKLLLSISGSTIDRLLKEERKRYELTSRSKTKPGTLLKHKIPVKTFSDWDNTKPGFVEIDLVGHDGGNLSGDFIQTLDLTDVATTWTETRAVKNKAQIWVFEALKKIKENVPFKISGIDSDNGSEFINDQLLRYCLDEKITFTRSSHYRKNDTCYVEQKNYTMVRKYVGQDRYDSEEELKILNELYDVLRLYTNFFLPTMKLISKTRIGSKIIKRYDKPKTPYQRVIESKYIEQKNKDELKELYKGLNPAKLKRTIGWIQAKLLKGQQKKWLFKVRDKGNLCV